VGCHHALTDSTTTTTASESRKTVGEQYKTATFTGDPPYSFPPYSFSTTGSTCRPVADPGITSGLGAALTMQVVVVLKPALDNDVLPMCRRHRRGRSPPRRRHVDATMDRTRSGVAVKPRSCRIFNPCSNTSPSCRRCRSLEAKAFSRDGVYDVDFDMGVCCEVFDGSW